MRMTCHMDGSASVEFEHHEAAAFNALMEVAIDRGTVDVEHYQTVVQMHETTSQAVLDLLDTYR